MERSGAAQCGAPAPWPMRSSALSPCCALTAIEFFSKSWSLSSSSAAAMLSSSWRTRDVPRIATRCPCARNARAPAPPPASYGARRGCSGHLRQSDVTDRPLLLQLPQRAQLILERYGEIDAVQLVQLDALQLEAADRGGGPPRSDARSPRGRLCHTRPKPVCGVKQPERATRPQRATAPSAARFLPSYGGAAVAPHLFGRPRPLPSGTALASP